MTVRVRPEEAADATAVREVIAAAFPTVDGSADGTVVEVGLNDELRRDPAWIPGLSLVAVRDGRVIGQVTSSYGTLIVSSGRSDPAGRSDLAIRSDLAGPSGEVRVVGVGPVAVRPSEQGAGVGRALLTMLIGRARAAGETALVLLGDPAFYRRFGFRPAAEVGITAPDPAWGVHFQALVLAPDAMPPTGSFRYAAPFDRL